VGHALAGQRHLVVTLMSTLQLVDHGAVERRNFDRSTEGSLAEADRHRHHQVIALALEKGMIADLDVEPHVAARLAGEAGMPLTAKDKLTPARDHTGRQFHLQVAHPLHETAGVASSTRLRDDLAAAAAARATPLHGQNE